MRTSNVCQGVTVDAHSEYGNLQRVPNTNFQGALKPSLLQYTLPSSVQADSLQRTMLPSSTLRMLLTFLP